MEFWKCTSDHFQMVTLLVSWPMTMICCLAANNHLFPQVDTSDVALLNEVSSDDVDYV